MLLKQNNGQDANEHVSLRDQNVVNSHRQQCVVHRSTARRSVVAAC